MPRMLRTPHSQGFTLIELMMTLLIATIALAIATPSFRSSIQTSQLKAQVNVISSAINYAQNEAIKTQTSTFFCGSTDQVNCNTSNFENGWIVFVDLNDDDAPGGTVNGVPENRRVGTKLDQTSIRLSSADSTSVLAFNNEGMITNEVAFTLCDDRGAESARALVVNISGQARIAVDENDPADNIVNIHNGSNAACP